MNSTRYLRAAAVLALLLAGPAARAAEPECKGTISGSVTATFGCLAGVTSHSGKYFFVVTGKDKLEKIPSYVPGSFELPGEPKVGTYTLDDLGLGRAAVAADGGALYSAQKTSSQRGEVTVKLTEVKPDPALAGTWKIHGTYRAVMPVVGGGKTGEVILEVRF